MRSGCASSWAVAEQPGGELASATRARTGHAAIQVNAAGPALPVGACASVELFSICSPRYAGVPSGLISRVSAARQRPVYDNAASDAICERAHIACLVNQVRNITVPIKEGARGRLLYQSGHYTGPNHPNQRIRYLRRKDLQPGLPRGRNPADTSKCHWRWWCPGRNSSLQRLNRPLPLCHRQRWKTAEARWPYC